MTETLTAPTASGGISIDLDPDVARANKRRRDYRYNTMVLPLLRLAGFVLLVGLVHVHAWLVPGLVSPRAARLFPAVCTGYSLLAWAILRWKYRTGARIDLALVFLTLDLVPICLAIYLTGGERSWLVLVLLSRVADQAFSTVRRTLFFAHAGPACYLVLLAYVSLVDGRHVSWPLETVKLLTMCSIGVYVSLTARAAARIRQRTSAVVALATRLVQELEAQSNDLRSSTRRAEEASRAKSEFLARMSHELRTPLNAITGMSALLASSPLTVEQRDSVSTIEASADHLLSLISDILDFSRIEAGRLSLERTDTDLRAVVDRVVRQLRTQVGGRALVVDCDVDAGVPRVVLGDPLRVAQVVMNLGANAVKFTERGRVAIAVRLLAREGNRARVGIEVADTGIGIEEEAIGRLFREFSQVDDSTTRKYGGTGLGLAICHKLTTLMGGTISVTSVPGAGSRFFVELPFEVPAPASQPDRPVAAPAAVEVASPSSPRVLVVEDHPINQKVAKKLLQKLGCDVTVVDNGREAVNAARAGNYALILMDCQMPEMDGFEATVAIRADEGAGRRTPIVALTANATTADRDRCLASGMDDFLAKPVKAETLAAVVSQWAA